MKKRCSNLDQRGVVSMFVTLVMMVVISLIILGLGQVARRNQSNALDRQLSSQAFYAAESGVNDSFSVLNTAGHVSSPTDFNTCNSFLDANHANHAQLSSQFNVGYTCVLVNERPTSLQISRITNGQSQAMPIHPNGQLKTLTLSWQATTDTSADGSHCAGLGDLPPSSGAGDWGCDYGLLRMDLVKVPASTTVQSLASNTASLYIKPSQDEFPSSATTINLFSPGATPPSQLQSQIIAAGCNNGTCKALLELPGGNDYYARFSGIYRDIVELHVDGTSTSGADLRFADAQVVVDSTGKAQNVLRRIRERLNISGNSAGDVPSNAIESVTTVCKRIVVGIGSNELCRP